MNATPRPDEGVVSWNINTTCNYRCSYCTQRFKEDRGRWAHDTPRFLAGFAGLPGRWEIKISGGEPFSHPTLDEIVAGLAGLGHRVSVVTNFSASRERLLAFATAARGRVSVFSCSLHLEYVDDVEEFIAKMLWLREELLLRADRSLPLPHLAATCVATRAFLPRLPGLVALFRERGLDLKVQPEKQDRDVIDYAPEEEEVLLQLGGHNRTGRIRHGFQGLPCWSGSRYFILDDRGEAFRCYPARRYKQERMGSFFSPAFRLHALRTPALPGGSHVRFKTFRALVIGGGLLGVFGIGTSGIWYVQSHSLTHRTVTDRSVTTPLRLADSSTPAPIVTVAQMTASASTNGTALRANDRALIAKLKTPLGGDKQKDALPGSGWKVNLYQDAGQTTPNRLKIDFNHNEKYDEKWSIDGGRVKRQVAPADDEKYTQEFFLSPDGTQWLSSQGAAAAVAPATAAPAPSAQTATAALAPGSIALRPMDTMILDRVAKDIPGDKVKDAIPGQSWKVNLYKDPGQAKLNRLKIDLDRDEKWDEKWTFTHADGRDEVKREVAPKDDEVYSEEYRLRAGAWVRKAP